MAVTKMAMTDDGNNLSTETALGLTLFKCPQHPTSRPTPSLLMATGGVALMATGSNSPTALQAPIAPTALQAPIAAMIRYGRFGGYTD